VLLKGEKESYVIASELNGTLKNKGEVLANTTITRRLRWNGNENGLVESFSTDADGVFSLPTHREVLSIGALNQFVAKMELEVEINGVVHELWYSSKFEPEEHSETGGVIGNIICDISEDEKTIRAGLSKVSTVCRWNDMPEAIY